MYTNTHSHTAMVAPEAETYARVASLPTISGGQILPDIVNVNYTAMRAIDDDTTRVGSMRSFDRTAPTRQLGPPTQTTGSKARVVSPSGRLVAVVNSEGTTVEVWDQECCLCVTSLVQCKKLFGKINVGDEFACFSFTSDEKRLLFAAERAPTQTTSFWGDSSGGQRAGEQFAYRQTWGEQNVHAVNPGLFILDIGTGVTSAVEGIDQTHTCGQAVWTPNDDGIVFVTWEAPCPRLGIKFYNTRPTKLMHVAVNKPKMAPPHASLASEKSLLSSPARGAAKAAREEAKEELGIGAGANVVTAHAIGGHPQAPCALYPRFAPNGKLLSFVSSPPSVMHNAVTQLLTLEWPAGPATSPRLLVGAPDAEAIAGHKDEFPGLWTRPPGPMWLDSETLVLHSDWRSLRVLLTVDATSGLVTPLTCVSYGSNQVTSVPTGPVASNTPAHTPLSSPVKQPHGGSPSSARASAPVDPAKFVGSWSVLDVSPNQGARPGCILATFSSPCCPPTPFIVRANGPCARFIFERLGPAPKATSCTLGIGNGASASASMAAMVASPAKTPIPAYLGASFASGGGSGSPQLSSVNMSALGHGDGNPTTVKGDNVRSMRWCKVTIDTEETHSYRLESILVLPAQNDDNERPPPCVLHPHGGPHSNLVAEYLVGISYLVQCGMAVLLTNYRGSTGHGQHVAESLPGRCGDSDVADCMSMLNSAAATGLIDMERVVVSGGSHGGFLTLHLIGQHPSVFKAAVARNPVTNIATMIGSTDIPDWCVVETQGLTTEDQPFGLSETTLVKAWQASPLQYASVVTTPLLFLVGGADLRVPPSQSVEAYNRFKTLGKDVDMKMYPESNHGLANVAAAEADQWVQVCRWLGKGIGLSQ